MKHWFLFVILVGIASMVIILSRLTSPPASLDRGQNENQQESIEVLVSNLEVPWDIDFLPGGQMLVTERPGKLVLIDQAQHVIPISGVRQTAEGGLLGLAVHPEFASNHYIYLFLTSQENGALVNRVERYRLSGNKVSDRTVILEGVRGNSVHDGGQLEFGPDKLLYITTGDSGQGNLAQDKNSLNGKILRIKDDGLIPEDNPFGNAVYSYGHRNPQGLAWDDKGQLWATEHGPSGIDGGTGMDELNLIEKGKNYGWPVIKGDAARQGMVTPVIQSGANETWAPSGLAFYQGKLFFAGLRGQTLYEYDLHSGDLKKYFVKVYGRLRAVKAGPEGLYITTSNRDGRGTPKAGDDKLILIPGFEALK